MFPLQETTTAWPTLRFAFNLAGASGIVIALGWFCAWLCRRRSAPFQHGILVSTVAVTACSPLLLLAAEVFGWGMLSVETPSAPRHDAVSDANTSGALKTETFRAAVAEAQAPAGPPQAAADKPVEPVEGHSPSAAPVPPKRSVPWRAIGHAALWIWGLGILVGLAFHASGLLSIRRFRRSLGRSSDEDLSMLAQSVCGQDDWRCRLDVFVSPLASAPMALGLVRPVIVMPKYLADEKSSEQLLVILRHEAAHVLRGDQWVALLQRMTAVAFWWNPLLHLVNRRLRHVRELICDDHAAGTRADGRLLAETLVGVAERSMTPQLRGATALVQVEARSLETRVRRLMERSSGVATRLNAGGRSLATAFALSLASLLVVGHVRAARALKPKSTVKVLRNDGSSAGNVGIAPAVVGFRKGLPKSSRFRVLRTDDSGRLEISERGAAAAYVARPESAAPTFFKADDSREAIKLTLPRRPIWLRHVPEKLRVEQLKVVASRTIRKGRELLTVNLTNNSGFDLILSPTDLSIFSAQWRVFPPKLQQRAGTIVRGHGGIATLQLDWGDYVQSGVWCRRSAAGEEWPDTDTQRKRGTPVRIRVAGVDSAPFSVTHPASVIARERTADKADPHKLAGRWQLTLPAGFQHRVSLTPLGRNRYRLTPRKLVMSGIYEVDGTSLRMVEPNDSRLLGPHPQRQAPGLMRSTFKWRVKNRKSDEVETVGSEDVVDKELLELIEEPSMRFGTGASYKGATLTRPSEK